MNAPLFKGLPEPQLGDLEKRDEADKEYNEPLEYSLDEQKETAMKGLFAPFEPKSNDELGSNPFVLNEDLGTKPMEDALNEPLDSLKSSEGNENVDIKKNTEEIKVSEVNETNDIEAKIDENSNSPLIDGLVSNELLTAEEGSLIKEVLIKGGNLKENILNIDGIDSDKLKQVTETMDYLSKPETKKECLDNFNKDFGEKIDGLKEVVNGSKKGEKYLVGRNKDLIELIGGNYLTFKNNDGGEEGNGEAFDRAIKTSLNQLMDGKEFKRPDTFNDMVNTVNNNTLTFEERFAELKKVDKVINVDQSRGNKKADVAFKDMKNGVEYKELSLKEKFNEFKTVVELAIKDNDSKKIDELLIEAKLLIDETESVGDVFVSSKIDVLVNGLNEGKEQA